MNASETSAHASALYTGNVMHQRVRPTSHRLRYGVFSLLVDVDELPALARRLKLFSLNRFNLFSLHERDYGDGAVTTSPTTDSHSRHAPGLRAYVERQLRAAGLPTGGAIRLLSMPRILGYAFNPLNVYFCHQPDGALRAVLYEVNNTFGQRHSYLIEVEPAQRHGGVPVTQRCPKQFHVSPFLGLNMQYLFQITPPRAERDDLRIGITVHDLEGAVLTARLDMRRRPLGDAGLALALLRHPLLTLKVVAGIHWEALRLWIKRVPLHRLPPTPVHDVTIINTTSP
jgi:DUF1365 family protein